MSQERSGSTRSGAASFPASILPFLEVEDLGRSGAGETYHALEGDHAGAGGVQEERSVELERRCTSSRRRVSPAVTRQPPP